MDDTTWWTAHDQAVEDLRRWWDTWPAGLDDGRPIYALHCAAEVARTRTPERVAALRRALVDLSACAQTTLLAAIGATVVAANAYNAQETVLRTGAYQLTEQSAYQAALLAKVQEIRARYLRP